MRNFAWNLRGTLGECLRKIAFTLEDFGVPESRVETEFFLSSLLSCGRSDLYLHLKRVLNEKEIYFCQQFLNLRKKRVPLAYILGKVEFMGLGFSVSPGVFIPRPETEILVEETINLIRGVHEFMGSRVQKKPVIVDLGTGSGCIAVSLAKYLDCLVYAVEVNEKAIEVARANAISNGVYSKISFLQGDLYRPLENLGLEGKIDAIVSNPPYVADPDLSGLEPEIFYEPQISLFGGKNGLEYYEKIVSGSKIFLRTQGYLIVEIGYGQSEEVERVFHLNNFRETKIVKDYSHIKRVIIGKVGPK